MRYRTLFKIKQQLDQIIWLTGQSGSGKTTLARALKARVGGIVLDGDEMRKSISTDLGFSPEDREKHNLRIARLARVLSKDTLVIVSVISPFEKIRDKVDEIARPIWVYVEKDIPSTAETPYEVPKTFYIKVNSDDQKVSEQVTILLRELRQRGISIRT